jgi:hypothetical protein
VTSTAPLQATRRERRRPWQHHRTPDTAAFPVAAGCAIVPPIWVYLLSYLAACESGHGPTTRALALNQDDQALYEWFRYDTRVLFGDFHLISDRLNAPTG